MKPVFWVFCTVIDNFGDIGVSWRLACELRQRLNAQVFLWLDDEKALAAIAPQFATEPNIIVKKWQENTWADLENASRAHVVIETFACRLPENVLQHIQQHQPVWLNWEYLSAEDWASRTHVMQSLQANGLKKYFWQMGFDETSGGLLRERNFITPTCSGSLKKWFLFGYYSEMWADTFHAWQDLEIPLQLDLAGTQIIDSLKKNHFLPSHALLENHDEWVSGCLKIRKMPFVPQSQFDDLLAQYDALFIRGEDSFVRAQWSGKPFFWHIYSQDEQAHLDKLDAFWQKFWQNQTAHPSLCMAHTALSQEFNHAFRLPENERIAHWQTLFQLALDWQHQHRTWQQYLLQQNDTVSRLAQWLANLPQFTACTPFQAA